MMSTSLLAATCLILISTTLSSPVSPVHADHTFPLCVRDVQGTFKTLPLYDSVLIKYRPDQCTIYCERRGLPYAALERGGYCSCGYDYQRYGAPVNMSYCSTPCTGDSSQSCGGPTKDSFSYSTIHKTDHICWRDPKVTICGYPGDHSLCLGNDVTQNSKAKNFTCICGEPGASGEFCRVRDCEIYDPCAKPGGRCIADTSNDTETGFRCECDDGGYGGTTCTEIDDCKSNPCRNNGQCIDRHGGYTCACPEDYYGKMCETYQPNKCLNEKLYPRCQNGGECSVVGSLAKCSCKSGFGGEFCERMMDADGDLCFNFECEGANCVDSSSRKMLNYCQRDNGFCVIQSLEKKGESSIKYKTSCAEKCTKGDKSEDNEDATNVECCDVDRCNYRMGGPGAGLLSGNSASRVGGAVSLAAVVVAALSCVL